MNILDYFAAPDRAYWLECLDRSEWRAARELVRLLREGQFHERLGEKSRLLLLTEGKELIAFCTYAQRDDIPSEDMYPWCGFIYTFPPFRGKRRMGKLLERVCRMAKHDGYPCVYIATDHEGLYEKYGCRFIGLMEDRSGNPSRVYRLDVPVRDYSGVLGKTVSGTVDRPAGSAHPRHPDLVYPINYGYVDGVMGGDGAEQDVYVMGTAEPLERFSGTVIAVLHRLNDCEDKWIVSTDGRRYTEEEITGAVSFQEQYFMGELYLLGEQGEEGGERK